MSVGGRDGGGQCVGGRTPATVFEVRLVRGVELCAVHAPCLQDKMVHWLLFVNMALVAIMLFVDLAVR